MELFDGHHVAPKVASPRRRTRQRRGDRSPAMDLKCNVLYDQVMRIEHDCPSSTCMVLMLTITARCRTQSLLDGWR